MANRRNECGALTTESAGVTALRMKKSRRTLRKQVILTKRIIGLPTYSSPLHCEVSPVYLNLDDGREVLA